MFGNKDTGWYWPSHQQAWAPCWIRNHQCHFNSSSQSYDHILVKTKNSFSTMSKECTYMALTFASYANVGVLPSSHFIVGCDDFLMSNINLWPNTTFLTYCVQRYAAFWDDYLSIYLHGWERRHLKNHISSQNKAHDCCTGFYTNVQIVFFFFLSHSFLSDTES